MSGDVVNIDFNLHEVYVNGEKLNEPYINEPTALSYDMQFPLTVEEGKVFVMGDNRNDSLDSRSSRIGLIDEPIYIRQGGGQASPDKGLEYLQGDRRLRRSGDRHLLSIKGRLIWKKSELKSRDPRRTP